MSNHKDDKALKDYLQGGSDLSRRYHAGEAEPPAHLDAAIIKAARSATTKRNGLQTRSWYVPLSLAAVVVIGVSIVFRLYEYQGNQLLSEPERDQLFDSIKSGKEVRQGAAAPPGMVASPPQTTQPVPDKDDVKNETRKGAVLEEQENMPAKKQVPAAALRMLKKEAIAPREAGAAMEEKARATGESPASTASEMMEPGQAAALGALGGARYSASTWLADIKQLWEAGKKDEAVAGLKQFLITYPDYPHADIIKQLPGDFDPGTYISGFEKNQ